METMSRTIRGSKPVGYAYWSARPLNRGEGLVGKYTKRSTSRIERRNAKIETDQELDNYFIYEGVRMIKLNQALLEKQQVPPKAEEAIISLHTLLDDIKANPEEYGTPLQVLEVVKCMEYTLQSLWRFPLSSKHHMNQFYIDGCLCPKMDNRERFGSGYFVFNMECPFHGVSEQKDKECKMMESLIV